MPPLPCTSRNVSTVHQSLYFITEKSSNLLKQNLFVQQVYFSIKKWGLPSSGGLEKVSVAGVNRQPILILNITHRIMHDISNDCLSAQYKRHSPSISIDIPVRTFRTCLPDSFVNSRSCSGDLAWARKFVGAGLDKSEAAGRNPSCTSDDTWDQLYEMIIAST